MWSFIGNPSAECRTNQLMNETNKIVIFVYIYFNFYFSYEMELFSNTITSRMNIYLGLVYIIVYYIVHNFKIIEDNNLNFSIFFLSFQCKIQINYFSCCFWWKIKQKFWLNEMETKTIKQHFIYTFQSSLFFLICLHLISITFILTKHLFHPFGRQRSM